MFNGGSVFMSAEVAVSLTERGYGALLGAKAEVFDYEKLLWFNGEYIRKLSPERYMELAAPYLPTDLPANVNREKLLTLLAGRISCFSEIPEKIGFFYEVAPYEVDLFPNKKNKVTLENAASYLTVAKDCLASVTDFTNDALFEALGKKAEELGVKAGALLWCVRVAVSGQSVTPGGATELLEVLGAEESLRRIELAISKL